MAEGQFDFGQATFLDAEAIGPPGQRRFRLTVLADEQSALLWMEKEQVAALSTAMEQQLVRSARRQRRPDTADDDTPPIPLNPTVDVRVRQLALGYDESSSVFLLEADAVQSDGDRPARFQCSATLDQARRLIRVIGRLMNTGRPTCPLCGAAIDGEHHCPRSNGHAQVVLS